MARKDSYAFDDSMPTGETMSDPAQPPVDETGEAPEAPETMAAEGAEGESLSLDIFGDKEPAVGDMVTLKVTAIDPENGRVTVILPGGAKPRGIEGAAAGLDEEDQASITA